MEEKLNRGVRRSKTGHVSVRQRRKKRRMLLHHLYIKSTVCILTIILVACATNRVLLVQGEGQTETDFHVTDMIVDSTAKPFGQEEKRPEKDDKLAPIIAGVRPILSYTNDEVDYESGILVTDDWDTEPVLKIDTSEVDLSLPGTYSVIYQAADHAGNTSEVYTTITVYKQEGGTAESAVIMEKADEILNTILVDGMTKREQIEGIYSWLRKHCMYSGHSDRLDYMQAGYVMLHDRTGDCYGFYAAAKLLFERLGIPNIDVVKKKNQSKDSEHFWNLVSLDGGETWYHFDATPRYGEGDDFCLVTDEFLDAYSESHKGSHHRDNSLYPATPEA